MITGEDIDRCIIENFHVELKGMTREEIQKELNQVQQLIDTETEWAEALSAKLRLMDRESFR